MLFRSEAPHQHEVEPGMAALEAVGPAALTSGTAIIGRLGPGLDGYRIRSDIRNVLNSIKV